tara:strand:+ start:3057 stop:3347 length:291 start_codon:yes stop_codon:yes gene_type:complete
MGKSKITWDNIGQFIEGNVKFYKDKLIGAPLYIQEQVEYRLSLCQDCVEREGCIKCNCPPLKKHWTVRSCNLDRFPDIMKEEEWNEFKKTIDDKRV